MRHSKIRYKNIRKLQKALGCIRGSSCFSNTSLLPTSTSHPHPLSRRLILKLLIVCALTNSSLSLLQSSTTLFVNQFLLISLLHLDFSRLNPLGVTSSSQLTFCSLLIFLCLFLCYFLFYPDY